MRTEIVSVAIRGRAYRGEPQHIEESPVKGKTNCLTTVAKDNMIMQRPRGEQRRKDIHRQSPYHDR